MADGSTFTVERSALIEAPPTTVHALIDNFRQWGLWSPWEALDPEMQRTYSGPDAGVGAHYGWDGKKAGAGTMDITASSPVEIVIDLRFTKPIRTNNLTTFALTPEATGTRVVWTMTGKHNLMSKLMGLFMSMDMVVGKDFEAGLARLRAASEATEAA